MSVATMLMIITIIQSGCTINLSCNTMIRMYISSHLKTITLAVFVALGSSVGSLQATDDNLRFDFIGNLHKVERHQSDYQEKILLGLTKEEFKKYRLEQILEKNDRFSNQFFSQRGIHVSVLFDVTDDMPEGINLYAHKESLVMPHLQPLAKKYSKKGRQVLPIKVIGEPNFHVDQYPDSRHRGTEWIDLFVDSVLIEHIINHPKFVDIVFAGTAGGIRYHGKISRFAPLDRSIIYNDSALRRGYFKEITEALELSLNVNVHIELNHDEVIEQVVDSLKPRDFTLISKNRTDFFASLNKRSADKLYQDPRVKMMKDYEFHHNIELSRGRWRPLPLNKVKVATEKEIFQIPFKSRTNVFYQPTVVIESSGQLTELFELLWKNGDNPYKEVIKKQDINFSTKNLILYSQGASSGSIGLYPNTPQWIDDELVIVIDQSSGGIQTMNYVQHFFAYVVDKSIAKVIFRSVDKKFVIENIASTFDETIKQSSPFKMCSRWDAN